MGMFKTIMSSSSPAFSKSLVAFSKRLGKMFSKTCQKPKFLKNLQDTILNAINVDVGHMTVINSYSHTFTQGLLC